MDRVKACPEFARFGIPDGDVAKYAAALPAELKTDFTAAMKLLLDKDFQKLLLEYPRPPKSFFRAEENQDTVTSEWMIRDGNGNDLKPEDYLAAFSRFVKENPDHIDAIQILLDRPRDWSTAALVELKDKLSKSRERFTPDLLQKAHAARYRKSLVDIISMVKHAAEEQQPLLTAEERVDRAFANLMVGKSFTPEQRKWLDRIRQHLVINLTVEKADFDALPVFADFGGWPKADSVFNGALLDVINTINGAVAA
jgi:type I restriction enzyme R subunit